MASKHLNAADEHELQCACAHEAGHEVVADYFGLKPRSFIASVCAGICVHRTGTPLQNAAIGWAGALAEDIIDLRGSGRTFPKFSLTTDTLEKWCAEIVRSNYSELSQLDINGIISHHSRLESCRLAFEILKPRKKLLQITGRVLADLSRQRAAEAELRFGRAVEEKQIDEFFLSYKTDVHREIDLEQQRNIDAIKALVDHRAKGIPFPEKFPASLESFWRTIVSNDCGHITSNTLERFNAWLLHEGRGDSQFASALFNCLSGGIHGPHSWVDWASKFQKWWAMQPQIKEAK